MPLVVASILLVPGYVDEVEIDLLTKFIAQINQEILTCFLALHPEYMLPTFLQPLCDTPRLP